MTQRTARCCCGDCTIAVEGEPTLNGLCHCTSCKRRTGSAFGWSAYFPDAGVRPAQGTTRSYTKDGPTGYDRHFCARCGTTLYWKSFGFLPDHTGIAGGCFVDEPLPAPNVSVRDDGCCAWLSLPEDWMRMP
jgi:hypothetical protein